jgi:hypothetical protein
MGYFRKFFEEDPSLLHSGSNETLIERYKADHPNYTQKGLKRAKQNLANLKSTLRKKEREEGGVRRAPRFNAAKMAPVAMDFGPTLEGLEEQIDECLGMARKLDRVKLENTIRYLRAARNEVSMIIG